MANYKLNKTDPKNLFQDEIINTFLVRAADGQNKFYKGDATKWSNKLFAITRNIDDIFCQRLEDTIGLYEDAFFKNLS